MSAGEPRDGFESSPVVSSAVRALRTFGGDINRGEATALLGMWAHRGELTSKEVGAILRRFPVAMVRHPADVCTNALHDHTTYHDRRGEVLPHPEPMTCNQCGEPAHYNYGLAQQEHDDPDVPDCARIKAVDRRRSSACIWRPAEPADNGTEPGA